MIDWIWVECRDYRCCTQRYHTLPVHNFTSPSLTSQCKCDCGNMQIEWEKIETVTDFIFLGSKITVDSDCSCEIKRCFSRVQFSCSVASNSLWSHGLQHARLPCLSPTPGVYSNSCPLSRWCHLTISSSVVPLPFCLQAFPASESFPVSQFFSSGGQSIEGSDSASVLPKNNQDWFSLGQIIGVSDSASVLPKNNQDWFSLGWTGLISLQSKRLTRVFSSTTVQKHQFFSA